MVWQLAIVRTVYVPKAFLPRWGVGGCCPKLWVSEDKGMNTEVTAARKAAIRERATALYRSGWYSAEDGKTMMGWMESGHGLIELERMLAQAELALEDHQWSQRRKGK